MRAPALSQARVTLALTLIALALRIIVALALHPSPAWDGELYERAARQIASGHGYTYAMFHPVVAAGSALGSEPLRPTAYYPVGYPAFLALVYALFGSSLRAMHLAGALVSALTVPLTHRLALRVAPPRAAAVAALALALMPGQIVFASSAMTEPLYGFLLVAAVLALARRAPAAPLARDAALFGALLGLATLVRPQALLLAPVLPLLRSGPSRFGAGLRARVAAALVATACCVATVSPWTLRNCRALDRCALVSTNGGSNLAIGAVHRADGGYLPVGPADGCVGVNGEVARDRCWRAVALAAIRAKPARWASLAVTKLDLTLSVEGFPTGYLVEARAIANDPARVRTARRALTGAWRLLLLACAFALLPLRRRNAPPEIARIALAACAVQLATHAVFFGGDRYHLPWVPLLCAFAACAFRELRAPPGAS